RSPPHQLPPPFSNTSPPSSTRATPPPPPGRCHASEPKSLPPSISASTRQISACSSEKYFAARSKRSVTVRMLPSTLAVEIRLNVGSHPPDSRHARVPRHLPQLPVADVVGEAVAHPLQHQQSVEEGQSPQRAPHVQGLRPAARRLHQAGPDPLDHGHVLAARVRRGARGAAGRRAA